MGGFAEQEMSFTRPWYQTPDFDRLVARTGHDRLAAGREVHGEDPIAMRVRLLRLEFQRGYQGGHEASD